MPQEAALQHRLAASRKSSALCLRVAALMQDQELADRLRGLSRDFDATANRMEAVLGHRQLPRPTERMG